VPWYLSRPPGGGSLDIHYGIFRRDTDGVREASAASTEFMMTCMDWARPVSATSTVLDLGSGHGGSTHAMVERFGCRVKCVACVGSLGLRG